LEIELRTCTGVPLARFRSPEVGPFDNDMLRRFLEVEYHWEKLARPAQEGLPTFDLPPFDRHLIAPLVGAHDEFWTTTPGVVVEPLPPPAMDADTMRYLDAGVPSPESKPNTETKQALQVLP
jgi:hypothetical protein